MIPMEPVTGPAVWTHADIADHQDWRVRLDDAALRELDALLAATERDLVDPAAFPALRAVLDTISRRLLKGSGFMLLQGFPVDRYSVSDIETMFLAFGRLAGKPISQNSYGQLLAHVRDEGKRVETRGEQLKGIRGYLSNEKLLFHTDLGDAVALLCLKKAKEGGQSSISSSMTVYNEILKQRPDLLPVYFKGFPFRSTEADGVPTEFRLPIYNNDQGVLSCAIRRMMIETSRINGVPYTDQENEALEYLDALAARQDFRYDMQLEPGDIQFLNNYVTFHSRTAFVDHDEPERRRDMLRLWLQLPGGRKHMSKYPVLYDGIPATIAKAS
jgi:hypothetical protein